jgi:hypothetical protein
MEANMGYRSQIIFVVEKPLVSSLLTLFATKPAVREMLTYDNPIETNDNGDMLFQIDWIKWYRDAFPEVQALDWMFENDEEHESHYSFNRLGEEFGDHDRRGFAEAWSVYPNQTLEVHS